MSEMLLLGAGASVEANVPGAYKMTEKIAERFRADPTRKRHAHVISFVIGGLLFEAGKKGLDPLSAGVNVEDLFNAVQLLAGRHTLEAAPFVGSWHAMVEEFDKVYPARPSTRSLGKVIYRYVSEGVRRALSETPASFEAGKIDKALQTTIRKTIEAALKNRSPSLYSNESVGGAVEHYVKATAKQWSSGLKHASPTGDSDLESELSRMIDRRQAQPGEGRIFYQTNERMIAALKELVWIDEPKAVKHLGPLVNLLRRQKRLVIATLNYDNAVEILAESQNIECETGIERWSDTGNFDFAGEGLSLQKLHGSIDWVRESKARQPDRPMPHSVIRRVTHEEMMKGEARPAVIFGQRNKLTAEGPFLDLLRAFREELSASKTLTVVGYSFRDPHINVYISQWLNASRDHQIRIINGPGFEGETTIEYVRDLLHHRSLFPEQVTIIPRFAGPGLEELYGPYGGSFERAHPEGQA